MEPYFSLQRWLTLSLLRLRFAGDTFSKKTQISLKENKWGYLLLIIKSKLSSKDDKFGNLVVTSVSLRASHCLALESEIDGVVVVQSFSCVWCFATPWTAASRLPCSTLSLGVCSNSCPLSRWYHPTIYCLLLLRPSLFPSIRVFPNESGLHIRWPKYWSFSVSPSNDYSGLISFRIYWFDLLVVTGTLKGLLQHHISKTSILRHSAFFMVQLAHPYTTTGKTIALTRRTFVSRATSLLFHMLPGSYWQLWFLIPRNVYQLWEDLHKSVDH